MQRLLLVEARKLIHYRTFWTFLVLHAGLLLMALTVASKITGAVDIDPAELGGFDLFGREQLWRNTAWIGSWFTYLLGLLVILLVTNEFESRTVRQQIIDGLSRTQLTACFVLLIVALSLFQMILILIYGGLFAGGGLTLTMPGLSFVPGSLVQCLGYLSLALFAGFMLRRAVPATALFLLWSLLIEPMVGWFIQSQLDVDVSPWLPTRVFANVVPSPVNLGDAPVAREVGFATLATAVGYVAAFVAATWARLETADL